VNTWGEFCEAAEAAYRNNPEWRRGQAWFNTLYTLHPEVAEQFRGAPDDPFYQDSKLDAFCERLSTYFQ